MCKPCESACMDSCLPSSFFASTEAGSSCCDEDAAENRSVLFPEEPLKDAELEERKPRWRLCLEVMSLAFTPPPSAEFCIEGGHHRVHHISLPVTEYVGDLSRRVLVREGAGPVDAACSKARLRTADGRLLPSNALISEIVGCGRLTLVARKSGLAATRCGCSVLRICSRCEALGINREPARVSFDAGSDV